MKYEILKEKRFKYIESGEGKSPLLLLHGLFGALSNFREIIEHFGNKYNVVVPILPLYDLPLRKTSMVGMVDYLTEFIEYKGYHDIHLLGNSLGGHIALLYALDHPEKVVTITLTGSSGLFENAFGTGFPKRGNYEFVKKRTEDTFYDPAVASKELVDEIFEIVNNRSKAIKVVSTAKSAIRHNLEDKLDVIKVPVLLIWGKQDTITPHYVGERFNELLENSELVFIDKCGHAPMMEHPEQFNKILEDFLAKHTNKKTS